MPHCTASSHHFMTASLNLLSASLISACGWSPMQNDCIIDSVNVSTKSPQSSKLSAACRAMKRVVKSFFSGIELPPLPSSFQGGVNGASFGYFLLIRLYSVSSLLLSSSGAVAPLDPWIFPAIAFTAPTHICGLSPAYQKG